MAAPATPSGIIRPLPVLPLRNTVIFPYLFVPLMVGKPPSVAAIEAALANEEKTFLALAQRDGGDTDQPQAANLYTVGTRVVIKKMARSDEGMELLVQGVERVALVSMEQTEPYLRAQVQAMPLPQERTPEVEALVRAVMDMAKRILELAQPQAQINLQQMAAQASDPMRLVYMFGAMLGLDVPSEQSLLEAPTQVEALRLLHGFMTHELQVQELRGQISTRAQTEISKEQKDYLLRQQLRAIQEELGEKNPEKAEAEVLRQRLTEADLPDEVRKEAERELARLERMPSAAPDFQLTRTYLELILELPWRKSTAEDLDLPHVRQVLDEDHYGLNDVKERILEHLAVLKLNPKARSPILCFVGPPGVGKTSLGQSIARAMGRKFERASLGGLHDESELRGHRRTYIGAMPGRIIQAIRRAGVNNPVLMLDEVDKLGRDFRGDPESALLEILDPAQNVSFRDNYLDLPFDLSHVFFITTANSLDPVSRPLLDRMEILRLTGYSEEEKEAIAKRYLIPRQKTEKGLADGQLTIEDEALKRIISRYTREAGVRQLEQQLSRLARRVALRFANGKTDPVAIQTQDLSDLLGPERFQQESVRRQLPPGVATGLAWTETGGEVLYIEASILPNSKSLRLTGQLGAVMKESAKAAQSFLWAHGQELGIDLQPYQNTGVHIHVPAGAVPKDGPSAGVAMATALASLYAQTPARSDTAMTGEITLSGLVLPIGGVREKVLAARRSGIRRVLLPKDNEKDLRDLPEGVRQDLDIIFAERVEEVLAAAIPGLAAKSVAAQFA
ncbi:MAG: endopeptidase La [Gemmataceae bacterium]